jgi:hypothetical protein
MQRTAIVMLACRDYEAMEVALACHAAYLPEHVPLFILQNCQGSYDADRTLAVGQRYEMLFPGRIRVVSSIPAGPAYRSIAKLLESEALAPYDLICKVDDDAFPIAKGWLDEMLVCWNEEVNKDGRPLAYVTPLINNNCWGFPQTLDAMGIRGDFHEEAAREHYAGPPSDRRVLPAAEISDGGHGSIWGYPYMARWLHEHTTLKPDDFISATRGLTPVEVPGAERYSIGCILLRRELWQQIDDGGSDDEHMLHQYCNQTNHRIVCTRSVPFVHFAYFTQREENRDIVERARSVYGRRLAHPFPIAMCGSRELEIESRLRWIEARLSVSIASQRQPSLRKLLGRAWHAVRRLLSG